MYTCVHMYTHPCTDVRREHLHVRYIYTYPYATHTTYTLLYPTTTPDTYTYTLVPIPCNYTPTHTHTYLILIPIHLLDDQYTSTYKHQTLYTTYILIHTHIWHMYGNTKMHTYVHMPLHPH